MLFPFYELEQYAKWAYDFEDFLLKASHDSYDKIRKIRSIIERKLRFLREEFEIPYISLPESIDLDEITDIFERINTMGLKLDVFDLLIARLSKYEGIELKKVWEDVTRRYPKFQKYNDSTDKMPYYILQSTSLSYNKTSSCKRADILNIYQNVFEKTGNDFGQTWYHISDYINKAISKLENLRDGFGVKDENQLPFTSIIPILASLIKEIEVRENKVDCNKKLNIWYWSSVFSNAYSGAVDSQLSADFKEMRDWFSNGDHIPKTVDRARRELEALNLREIRSKGGAIYKGVLSLIALEGAKDFNTKEVLENALNNDKDHLFPVAEFVSKYTNSVLNITWMSDKTNRNIKHYKRPSVYIRKFVDGQYGGNEKEFKNVLKTHLINDYAYECMLKDDFEGFIIEREKVVLSKIKELIGIGGPMQTADLNIPQPEKLEDLIKQGESNTLEFKSSMLTPTKLNDSILSKERTLEKMTGQQRMVLEQTIIKERKFLIQSLQHEVFKTVAAFMNSEGGVLLIGVEDDGTISGIEKDYECFGEKKNWDVWLQHFTNLIKEHIGMDVIIYIKARPIILEGKTIAVIDIKKSSKPIYVEYQDIKGQNKMEFYIRATGTTYALNPKQTNDFIKERWKDR